MVVSSVAHLWALHRDLPVPDPDEATFARAAVHIAGTGDANPHWFGHPGSTVIYPVAGMLHAWDVLAHHGPIVTSDASLTARFERSPTEFYVIGRLWTITLSVGALPLLFLVGRRAFNTRVALIAAALWAVLPYPMQFGRMVRTDSAAVFFGLLSLWLCLRLFDEPRIRWCVLAGLSVGLAISSRYFMVALVPILVATAVLPRRHALGRALRSAGIALASVVAGFATSTPYFFLDWHAAMDSLRAENPAVNPHPVTGGLSPIGNLRWYLGTAIPASMTWALVALTAAGVVLVISRRRASQLLLLGFCAIFLAGLCLSKLHQKRWVLEILPMLTLFAAAAVDTAIHAITARAHARRASIFAPAALVAVTAVLAIQPAANLVDVAQNPSISGVARAWIVTHLPRGSRFIQEKVKIPLDHSSMHADYRSNLRPHTLAEYQGAGYEYLVVSKYWASYYMSSSARYPREVAFYLDVACHTRLIAEFRPTSTRTGWPISIYQLDERPRRLFSYLCDQHAPNQ
jgi:4-amino-4-deoxy-L-arabinose transferase-like glycosyltransferase